MISVTLNTKPCTGRELRSFMELRVGSTTPEAKKQLAETQSRKTTLRGLGFRGYRFIGFIGFRGFGFLV